MEYVFRGQDHFHVCVVDGVFEALPNALAVKFHAATGLDEAIIAQVQANVRKRILRAFVARGHIEPGDAKDMAAYAHGGGFSVDAAVRIEAADRAGLERLLRYCARPPFAMERLRQSGADLVYRCGKGHGEPLPVRQILGRTGAHALELIDRIAQLVPPPRTHRHRYYGVLAPNSPVRAAVTAMAQVAATPVMSNPVADAAHTDAASAVSGPGVAAPSEAQVKPQPRVPASYLWAALIARIYEVFPLICPHCGGTMRIIAFITFSADIHKILEHIGVDSEAPRHAGHRCGMTVVLRIKARVWISPDWRDVTNQSATDDSPDQRTDW